MGGRASSASKNRWNEQNYDRVTLMVPKGDKERIRGYADRAGVSLNGYVRNALAEKMARDDKLDTIEEV